MVTLNSQAPGLFPLSSFTSFDDTAVITGLGEDSATYGPFKSNILATGGNPVNAAKTPDYEKCL